MLTQGNALQISGGSDRGRIPVKSPGSRSDGSRPFFPGRKFGVYLIPLYVFKENDILWNQDPIKNYFALHVSIRV